ncbi:MAG: murein hydrolase activator EnvC family protein [Bacilli bacterium]
MKNFIKVAFATAFTIVSCFAVIDNDMSAKTLNDLYSELSALESEVTNTKTSIAETEQNIENNKAAIEQAATDISTKQTEIIDNQTEINTLEGEKDTKKEEIKDLLVYYQTNNTINAEISFVVDAQSLTDSIHRETTVDILTEKSNGKIDEFIAIQEDLETKNENLVSDISELENMQAKFETAIAEYEVTLNDLSEYQVSAADEVGDMKNTISYYEGLGCKKTEDLEVCKNRTSNVVPNSSGFVSPMNSGYISSEMGWRWGAMHAGLDMFSGDTRILAAAPGIVGAIGYDGSRGNYVYVHHTINGQRYSTAYFHMSSSAYVSMGQQVDVNTQLGNMGNTGNSTGAHLHFEILVDWYGLTGYNTSLARNPRNYLSYPAIGVYWSGRNR